MPSCGHNSQTFHCHRIQPQDIRRFHQSFYANEGKVAQDAFLLKYTSQNKPQRTSRAKVPGSSRKMCVNSYFVKTREGCKQVCAKTFLTILGISRYRVQNLCRKHLATGASPRECRGGDRRSDKYEAKRQLVMKFIMSLRPVESHYMRDKSKRQYLPCGLNIKTLWRTYNNHTDDVAFKVTYQFFRKIFLYKFNISFKTPATDACSTCLQLKNEIQQAGHGSQKKSDLMIQLRVHILKSKAFYSHLHETETNNILLFSYDCQKNLVLPRVPDQAAYYSRQLYYYNFTVCRGHSKAPQNTDTVTMYTWLENERHKGSNEIASALLDTLRNAKLEDSNYECVRLCSDGCPGQNKNSTVIGVVMKWFKDESPKSVERVEIVFPIVGHSFLPPDRVFGRIEKVIRSVGTIETPSKYTAILKDFGTVKRLGAEVPVHDWKSAVQDVIKPTGQWNFKLSLSKRIILTRNTKGNIIVQGEAHYRCDCGVPGTILKKSKSISSMMPIQLDNTVPVKRAKLNDVANLLSKHFGANWREREDLVYYRSVIDGEEDVINEVPNEDDSIDEEIVDEGIVDEVPGLVI